MRKVERGYADVEAEVGWTKPQRVFLRMKR